MYLYCFLVSLSQSLLFVITHFQIWIIILIWDNLKRFIIFRFLLLIIFITFLFSSQFTKSFPLFFIFTIHYLILGLFITSFTRIITILIDWITFLYKSSIIFKFLFRLLLIITKFYFLTILFDNWVSPIFEYFFCAWCCVYLISSQIFL